MGANKTLIRFIVFTLKTHSLFVMTNIFKNFKFVALGADRVSTIALFHDCPPLLYKIRDVFFPAAEVSFFSSFISVNSLSVGLERFR